MIYNYMEQNPHGEYILSAKTIANVLIMLVLRIIQHPETHEKRVDIRYNAGTQWTQFGVMFTREEFEQFVNASVEDNFMVISSTDTRRVELNCQRGIGIVIISVMTPTRSRRIVMTTAQFDYICEKEREILGHLN